MDALDIQNAVMEGMAMYREWEQEFLSAWQEGVVKGNIKQAWAMMPTELKDELKRRDPKGYEQAMMLLKGD